MKVSAVGIPWYSETDYDRLRGMFEDGHTLHETYNDWLQTADGIFERLKGEGTVVEKVYIKPEEFSSWCAKNGLRLNSHARTKFANDVVRLKHFNIG